MDCVVMHVMCVSIVLTDGSLYPRRALSPKIFEEAVEPVTAVWSKFCSLTDILEYSLVDIAEWLPRYSRSN
jgi:hypothetical protein